jgi:4-phosphopantoate---beta-alanine ligase
MRIPKSHPRYNSLSIREKISNSLKEGIISEHGIIAHGRGETFDYLIGEQTTVVARKSINSATALLLLAKNPVISINGNTAALVSDSIVKLSKIIPAKLEVNIFHPSQERERKIKRRLIKSGCKEVLLPQKSAKLKYLESNRKFVNKCGIYSADVVLVPLEDGDRTEALVKNGKKVIVIDLNPLSRSAQKSTITIVDNITRAVPEMIKSVMWYKKNKFTGKQLETAYRHHNNVKRLKESLKIIKNNLF